MGLTSGVGKVTSTNPRQEGTPSLLAEVDTSIVLGTISVERVRRTGSFDSERKRRPQPRPTDINPDCLSSPKTTGITFDVMNLKMCRLRQNLAKHCAMQHTGFSDKIS